MNMKLLLLGLLFSIPVMSQTSLYFSGAFKAKKKYVFETSDVIYFSESRSGADSNLCNNRNYRVRDNEIILHLQSTPASSIVIYGSSTGNQGRTVKSIAISDSRKGNYSPLTCQIESNIGPLNKGCGTIVLKELEIPKGTFVKINFGDNTNISEIEILP